MATTSNPEEQNKGKEGEHKYRGTYERLNHIVESLPKEKGWMNCESLVQFKGFWMSTDFSLIGLLLIEDHFKSRPDDVFLASSPKTGTTWLKSLIFTIINRGCYDFSDHPLLKTNPHDLVLYLERYMYKKTEGASELESLPSPRLLNTHLPYSLLPESLAASSGCRFIYICRDPKDVFISFMHFANIIYRRTNGLPPLTIEEALDGFCKGISLYGPYWDHVLGYWTASLENPDKILFLNYEDMKREPLVNVKKLAEFLGQPFSVKEEKEGVVEEVMRLCSFQNLSNLDVNKVKEATSNFRVATKKDFFRKGEVGDWKNYMTPEMAAYLDRITDEKLIGSGFSFGCSSN